VTPRQRFIDLVCRLTGKPQRVLIGGGWFEILFGLYNEPHRRYHDLGHITNLLARLDRLTPYSRPGLDRMLETEIAIWFHDAVYEVGSARNEESSALLARAFLFSLDAVDDGPTNGNKAGALLDAVNEAILATKHDGRQISGNGTRLMIDLDLAHFADPWATFDESNKRIREEYAAVNEDAYRYGRTAFLTQLMSRPIYHVLTELEEPARENLRKHVKELVG
jgi:predicted metal-dependent HD superfamily phosphohydrolase